MDLQIKNHKFIVTGASSGLGRAVAEILLNNGAEIIAVARNKAKLFQLKDQWPEKTTVIPGDVTDSSFLNFLIKTLPDDLYGAFINAGGPPATTISETTMEQWDEAYKLVLRWKIELSKYLLPIFKANKKGRLLFSESASVNSPIPNLVLSNAFRMAVVGFAKTLSKEINHQDITANVIAPGYHETAAIDRIIKKITEKKGISYNEVKKDLTSKIPVGRMGKPKEFASLAAWLLSPLSGFASGQVFTLDGGGNK